jgi:exonuclease VII small subunit
MNKDRRKSLAEALALIDQAEALLQQASEAVDEVRDEEQEAFDNLPESLQDGERGQQMQEAVSSLESVDFDGILDTPRDYIQQAIDA